MFDGFMWNMMNRGTWACTIFNHPNSVAAAENENLGSLPSDMHALRAVLPRLDGRIVRIACSQAVLTMSRKGAQLWLGRGPEQRIHRGST